MIDREEKHGGRVAFADFQTMETAFAKEELGPQDLKMGNPPRPWLSPSLPLWLPCRSDCLIIRKGLLVKHNPLNVVRRLGLGICPSTSHSHSHSLSPVLVVVMGSMELKTL